MNLKSADIQLLKTIQLLAENTGNGCVAATVEKIAKASGGQMEPLSEQLDLLRENRFLYLNPEGLYVITVKARQKIGRGFQE